MTYNTVAPASPRLRFLALGAGNGDCLVLEYGTAGTRHRIIVDGGVESTYSELKRVLDSSGEVDSTLFVVTHIDSDHIGGTIRFVEDKEQLGKVSDFWFNGQRQLFDSGTEKMGVKQGDRLSRLLGENNVPWNVAFQEGTVSLSSENAPVVVNLNDDAKLTVLSPGAAQLDMLRVHWDVEVAKLDGLPISQLAAPATPSGLERMGPSSINIRQTATAVTKLDRAVANGSSIAFLFEFAGKKVLLASDAFPSVLVDAGRKLAGGNPVPVDVFKLAHHGSALNTTTELLRMYPAQTYIFSTNGSVHGHPDDEAIARVVLQNPQANLLFNYANEGFKRWETVAGRDSSKFLVGHGGAENCIDIELFP
jgi:beta-lactamase superfamily II metal-dependent hydrolase